jgi:hypothetical protein
MQRLLSGLLCFAALYTLCGCAAYKDSFSRSAQGTARQTETEASASIAGTNENTCALIPGTAQTCRIDSATCLVQATSSPVEAPQKSAPIVQVPETSHDFGTMQEDKEFFHKFLVKNTGTSELVIKKIIPT